MMTRDQIIQMKAMRQAGSPYSKIAEVLSLSVNTVKSYCIRHGISPEKQPLPEPDPGTFCKACGKKIPEMPGRKPRKFCSDECRVNWWNSHPEAVRRKAVYSFTCACCGKTFTAYGNAHRKYCSHQCYIRHRFGGDEGND